jgi:hypothetical protein
VVPRANAEEACLASGLKVFAVDHLLEAVAHFNGHTPVEPYVSDGLIHAAKPYPDLNEVQGQMAAKRALLIAAAARTTCCSAGRRALAKRCWRVACRACCRPCPNPKRWKWRRFNRSPAACR